MNRSKAALGALAVVSLLAGGIAATLTGCAKKAGEAAPSAKEAGKLNIYIWSAYLPQEVIDKFAADTGIKVNFDTYDSNEALLEKLQSGYAQAIEAMQEVGEVESMKLEHRNSHLGLVGMISPMVGLLGTVVGMVASFRTIDREVLAEFSTRTDRTASGLAPNAHGRSAQRQRAMSL